MEAKDFELPIEGSLSKLALLHIQQEAEQSRPAEPIVKTVKSPVKSYEKKKSTRTTNKK